MRVRSLAALLGAVLPCGACAVYLDPDGLGPGASVGERLQAVMSSREEAPFIANTPSVIPFPTFSVSNVNDS